MGIGDLFKPKWNHLKASIRLTEVCKISDQKMLAKIVRRTTHDDVEDAALNKIKDQTILQKIIIRVSATPKSGIRRAVLDKIDNQIILRWRHL